MTCFFIAWAMLGVGFVMGAWWRGSRFEERDHE